MSFLSLILVILKNNRTRKRISNSVIGKIVRNSIIFAVIRGLRSPLYSEMLWFKTYRLIFPIHKIHNIPFGVQFWLYNLTDFFFYLHFNEITIKVRKDRPYQDMRLLLFMVGQGIDAFFKLLYMYEIIIQIGFPIRNWMLCIFVGNIDKNIKNHINIDIYQQWLFWHTNLTCSFYFLAAIFKI